MFSLFFGCSHILTFIAGTKNIFLFDANNTVDARSSAIPLLNFAILLAVAGITKIRSAHLDKEI